MVSRMKKTLLLALLISAALADAADTATNRTVVTPNFVMDRLAEVRANHPSLRAGRERINAVRLSTNITFAAAMGLGSAFMDGADLGGGDGCQNLGQEECAGGLSFTFDMVAALSSGADQTNHLAYTSLTRETLRTDCRARSLERSLVTQLFDMALLDRELELRASDVVCQQMIVDARAKQYDVSALPQRELFEAQNSLAKSNEELQTLRDKHRLAQLTLNRLLGRPLDQSWPTLQLPEVAAPVPFSTRMASMASRSDPQLTFLNQQKHQAEALARQPNQSESRREMTGAFVRAATFERSGRQQWIGEYISQLSIELDAARRQALLYRDEIIPRQRQIVGNMEAACQTSRSGFCDLLDAQRALIEGELAYARAVAEQHRLLADFYLMGALGGTAEVRARVWTTKAVR